MPVMPSFTGFAATPDLGGNFNQGRSIALRAQEAQQQLQMQQQKLAQESQQAAMENEIKQQQLQQQAMKDQQALEIEKAYKEQAISIQQSEAKVKQDQLNFSIQKAARAFQANQSYQKDAADMIASGIEPDKAFMQSALKWGPDMDLPGGAYSAAMRDSIPRGGADMPDIGKVLPVEGRPDLSQFVSGKGSRQLIKNEANIDGEGADVPEGFLKYGKTLVRDVALSDAKQERNRLIKLQDADVPGQLAAQQKEAEPDKPLNKGRKLALDRFEARQKQIKELESRIHPSSSGGSASKYKEGQKIRSKKDGKLYIVKDGVPQLAE